MIDAADLALVEAARDAIRRCYCAGRHVVGAALRTRNGQIVTGIHLEATVGRIAVCAEAIALGTAATAFGEVEIDAIVAVYHPDPSGDDPQPVVVPPCGMCRELIADYGPNSYIIVTGPQGDLTRVPIATLLPMKFLHPLSGT